MDEQVTPEPGQEQQGNKIEARINKLYGEKMEAVENAQAFKVENDELRTQMTQLQEQVAELQTPAVTPTPQAGNDGNAGALDEAKLHAIIEESVGKVLSNNQATAKKQQALRQAQETSWGSAVAEMGVLKDQQSDLYRTAQNIWARDPELKASPNGPYKAAVMARGIVGFDASPDVNGVNAAQQQQTINQNFNTGSVDSAIAKLDQEIKVAKEALATPSAGAIGGLWGKYKDLQAKKGELLRQKKGS